MRNQDHFMGDHIPFPISKANMGAEEGTDKFDVK